MGFYLQQLESVWWMEDGEQILSSHSDGSYCCWLTTGSDVQSEPEKQDTPYGEVTATSQTAKLLLLY